MDGGQRQGMREDSAMRILLVNTNRMVPPIAPVGLDYLASVLTAAGHQVHLLDLCFEPEPDAAIDREIGAADYQLVGVSVRNTDDCYYPGLGWFLPDVRRIVERIRSRTATPVVLGGVGFSIMSEAVLDAVGANLGVRGEGEFAMLRLAAGEETAPGLVRRTDAGFEAAPRASGDLSILPGSTREAVDNARYYEAGGQIGFQTKRGCDAHCIYCADPVAAGRSVRLRPPAVVAGEVGKLAARGIMHLHTCDAEFNRPLDHALAVCHALIEQRLGDRLRWYAYCAPTPFPEELALAMRAAGCAGINFGADSGDHSMLRRLGRDHSSGDLRVAAERCRNNGMASMFDLLLGGPGETEATVRRSLRVVREAEPDRVGLSVGVRVYPGTPLAQYARTHPNALHGPGAHDGGFAAPAYYLSPALGESIFGLVSREVEDDPRFFFSDPTSTDRNYNYSDNTVLVDAIARGYRGAYWDILRRLQEGLPPE